jgi:hypothetical protein
MQMPSTNPAKLQNVQLLHQPTVQDAHAKLQMVLETVLCCITSSWPFAPHHCASASIMPATAAALLPLTQQYLHHLQLA